MTSVVFMISMKATFIAISVADVSLAAKKTIFTAINANLVCSSSFKITSADKVALKTTVLFV